MRRLRLAVAIAIAAACGPALAYDGFPAQLTPADRQRIDSYDAVRGEAIDEATKGGEVKEVQELGRILEGAPQTFANADLVGRWRCRTAKLGGSLPLVIYPDFDCRIVETAGGGLRFEKLTGSQRTAGTLYPVDANRLGYAGSSWYGYEKGPKAYAADAERDEVAYLFRVGPKRLRLEFPSPRQESRLDVMELRRR